MRKKPKALSLLKLGIVMLVFIFLSFSLYSCKMEEPKYSRIKESKKPLEPAPLEPVKEFKGVILDEDLGRKLAEIKNTYAARCQGSGEWMDRIGQCESEHRKLITNLLIQSIRNQQKILSQLENQGAIRPSAEEQTPSVETSPSVETLPPESGPKPFEIEP